MTYFAKNIIVGWYRLSYFPYLLSVTSSTSEASSRAPFYSSFPYFKSGRTTSNCIDDGIDGKSLSSSVFIPSLPGITFINSFFLTIVQFLYPTLLGCLVISKYYVVLPLILKKKNEINEKFRMFVFSIRGEEDAISVYFHVREYCFKADSHMLDDRDSEMDDSRIL